MHTIILGMTESGKSELAKRIAKNLYTSGSPVIICNPHRESGWPSGAYQTADPEQMLETAKRSRSCFLFCDEAAEYITNYREHKKFKWLTTVARHWGHQSFIISQRANLISRTVRTQCNQLIVFMMHIDEAWELTKEWNKKEIENVCDFQKGEYLLCRRFGPVQHFKLFKERQKND